MKLGKKDSSKEKMFESYFEGTDEETVDTSYQPKRTSPYESSSVRHQSDVKNPAIISSETVIHGNITLDNDIEIEGQIVGDIIAEGVVKVTGGSITGNIKAIKILIRNSTINGNLDSETMIDVLDGSDITGNITGGDIIIGCKCKGNIVAVDRLKLLEDAHVKGDMKTRVIKIDEGAVVDGKFKMM